MTDRLKKSIQEYYDAVRDDFWHCEMKEKSNLTPYFKASDSINDALFEEYKLDDEEVYYVKRVIKTLAENEVYFGLKVPYDEIVEYILCSKFESSSYQIPGLY